ncbi:MAG: hypothetical protein ONB44_18105 [candidate division KSB1 bacterium]|nr:hypothetical protein [candidate division KSB1 bacterium]MDZ7304042.1 hypothetical protein [candidate division KSB1 bacterium]MDZ7313247.1 hypothetical protein [candidate division KSB1 bacterium]
MKRTLFSLLLGLAVSAFLLTACSKDQPLGPEQDLGTPEQFSLEKEFGGFTTNDEIPAFGDAALLSETVEDVDVNDPISSLSKNAMALESAAVKSYVVRLTWGKLEFDSTATQVQDWSGSVEINKGTLAILKTIQFEPGDYIHLPRTSRKKVEFTSTIQKSFDGILVAIIDNDTSAAEIAGTMTFTAGSYSRVLSFTELDSLNLVEPVGSSGDEVSIISRVKEVVPFDGGFLAGRWIKNSPHAGIFRGRWINSLGTNAGYLRGIWGVRQNGEKVFFGKYISMNGEFRGLLAGHWAYNRDEDHGVFKGVWYDRNHQASGTLHGHFKSGRPGDGRGYFHGRWHKDQ